LLTPGTNRAAGARLDIHARGLWVQVHEHAKKELGQYPAILTEQVWSIAYNRPSQRKEIKHNSLLAQLPIKTFQQAVFQIID